MAHMDMFDFLEDAGRKIDAAAQGMDPVVLEACKNARALTRVCELLDPLEVDRREYLEELRAEIMRDYDPDVDGWPWETDHL